MKLAVQLSQLVVLLDALLPSVSGMNPQLRSSPDKQSTTGSVEIGMIQDSQKLKQ
jgi:hypothetical protein